jgi:hypothetical protein
VIQVTNRRIALGLLISAFCPGIAACVSEVEVDRGLETTAGTGQPGATPSSDLSEVSNDLVAADKSRWPRVSPVLFVHGVNSSPATWGIEPQRERRAYLFPADDDSKTGNWFWHKSELAGIEHCSSLQVAPLGGPPGSIREIFPGRAPDLCLRGNLPAEAILGGPSPSQAKRLIFAANTEFGSTSTEPTLVEAYDQAQAKVTGRSRNLIFGLDGTFGHEGAKGDGALISSSTFTGFPARSGPAALPKSFTTAVDPDVVGLAERANGIEVFDAYWTNGWPDGVVPKELSGPDGMLYGYYLDKFGGTKGGTCQGNCPSGTPSPARFTRTITYRATSRFTAATPAELEEKELSTLGELLPVRGTGFTGSNPGVISYAPVSREEFGALPEAGSRSAYANMAAMLSSQLVRDVISAHTEAESMGIVGFCGHGTTCRYIFRRTTDKKYSNDSSGKSTVYIHELIAESASGRNYHLRVQYEDRHEGYDGRPLAEETADGEIGQLYQAIVRVLDKYYVDAAGKPNWRRGGDSDPDAKIVLVGHSQGGVISRAVLYPGFGPRGQYDSAQGYLPMYWPASEEVGGQAPIDVRRHVAGVVTTSSPHYGAQIGFPLEGFEKMHREMIAQRKTGTGFYVTAFDGKVIQSLAAAGQDIIASVNPSATEPTATAVATEQALAGLRDLQRNAANGSYKMFEMLQGKGIPDITHGLAFWKNDGIANPCGGNGRIAGTRNMNYYRLFWQPEYDNWTRSFRRGSITGAADRFNQLTTNDDYFDFSQRLCQEQVGHFTYVDDGIGSVNDPFSAHWNLRGGPLAKTTGGPGDIVRNFTVPPGLGLETAKNNFARCIDEIYSKDNLFMLGGMAIVGDFLPGWLRLPIHAFAANGVANEIEGAFANAENCIENLKMDVTNALHDIYFPYSTAAAQGLAYHPASAFLHRLNQKGGPSLWDEKRPYPVRPDGGPIPFINVVNRISPNNLEQVPTRAMYGDTAVQTLSQDLGFGYPEMAKAGSLTKISFTGYIHTEATVMKPSTLGPYCTVDPANPAAGCVLDPAKNAQMLADNRRAIANLLLGLATGQSPVLPNAGFAFAKPAAIASQYATRDTDGHLIQKNDRAPVTGDATRLKGLQIEDILEPLPLPYDRGARRFVVDGAVVVHQKQELYLPPGASVLFNDGAGLTVEAGGRLTVGGAPAFGVTDDVAAVRLTTASDGALPILLKAGAQIRFPDAGRAVLRGALKRLVRGPDGAQVSVAVPLDPNALGSEPPIDATKPSAKYYAKYDAKPYLTRVTNVDTALTSAPPPPPAPACDGTAGQWSGCRGNGCSVCTDALVGFSRYFANHPGCAQNPTCGGLFFTCNAACPAPTDADRDPPTCDGTAGQWSGCRGNGCSVCTDALVGFSRYFANHPGCAQNPTCGGLFFTCNAACPAPTDADR